MKHVVIAGLSPLKGLVLLSAAVGVGLLGGICARPAQASPPSGYTLAWSDEFNGAIGSPPNAANWNIDTGTGSDGWGNWEMQTYTSSASNMEIVSDSAATDGRVLAITANDNNGTVTSGMIDSYGKQQPTFGYIEVRAKNPIGTGFWPAFWMLGTDESTSGWPQCGEQDIMELFTGNDGVNMGSWHMNYDGEPITWTATYTLAGGATFNQAYHTFGLQWTQTAVTDNVDGVTYETHAASNSPGWIFNHPFYYILNLAVGGDAGAGTPTASQFPQTLYVDYVRYYTGPTAYSPGISPTTDTANDFTVTYNTSGNWTIDTSNTAYFNNDPHRFCRTYNGTEFLNYQFANVSAINATVYTYQPDNGGTTAVTAWYSTNYGSSYTQLATTSSAWTATSSSWGYYTLKNSGSLPIGVTDVRLQLAPTTVAWDTEIGNVTVSYGAVSAPSAPTGLTATAGVGVVTLSWTGSSGATSYCVYRSTTSGGEGSSPMSSGITGTSYTDTSVANGAAYYYTTAAVNAGGTSAQSGQVSATPESANGTWQLTPENNTALRLDVEGNGTANGTLLDAYTSNGTTAQSFVFSNSGVNPSGDYNFVKSGGAYCIQDAGATSGSSVEVYACAGSAAQAWAITANASPTGYYELKPSNATGLCLNNTGTTSGSAVTVATCTGVSAQQWSGL